MEVDKTKGDNLIDEINMLVIGGGEENREILLTSPHTVYLMNDALRDKVIRLFSNYFSTMSNDGVSTEDLYADLERIDGILEKAMLTNIVHLIIDSSLTEILYYVNYGPYRHFFSHLIYTGGEKNYDILHRAVVSKENTKNVNRVISAMVDVISPDRKFIDKVLLWEENNQISKKSHRDTYMDLLIKQKNLVTIKYVDRIVDQKVPYVNSDIYTNIASQNFNEYEDFLYEFYTNTKIGRSYLVDPIHPTKSHIFKIAFLCAFNMEKEHWMKKNQDSIISMLMFIRRVEKFLKVNFLDNKLPLLFEEKQNPLKSIIERMILNSTHDHISEETRRIIHTFESETKNDPSPLDPESELRVMINTLNGKKLSRNEYSQLAMVLDDYADSYTNVMDKTSTQNFVYYLKRYYEITSMQSADIMKDSLKMIEQIMTKIVLKLSINDFTKFITDLYEFINILDFPVLKKIMVNVHENDVKASKATVSVLKKFVKK